MKDFIPIALSLASLCLSVFTLWMTQLRRGDLKMTQPTLLCLKREMPSGRYKLFFRALLFCTASKGCGVEQIYVTVQTVHGDYRFDFWGHTEGGKLTLGSGLFVSQAGVCADHHFNPRSDTLGFIFHDGQYRACVYAKIVGKQKPRKLKELTFDVSGHEAASLTQIMDAELYLYWNPEVGRYETELRRHSEALFVPVEAARS